MGKLIIIEGQDRCGKSILCKNLKSSIKDPKIVTIHSSAPPIGVNSCWSIRHYSAIFDNITTLMESDFVIIFDRFHLSETVYGPTYRNSNTDYIWELEETLISYIGTSSHLILLTDEGKNISKRDDGLSLENSAYHYDIIKDKFEDSFDTSCIKNKLHLNIADDGWCDVNNIFDWVYK